MARSLSVLGSAFLPNLYASFAAAKVILTANQDTAARIPKRYRHKVKAMLETGIAKGFVQPASAREAEGRVRVAWVSRMEKIKGCALALRAFSLAAKEVEGLRLTCVGDGPEANGVRRLAARVGIESLVTWEGAVTRQAIPHLLSRHDVFLFTSLRDTSGNVLLEAMAAGLPAVTLRHHGAAEIATDETAIRVKVSSVPETTAGIAKALVQLAGSVELRRRMGEAAVARVARHYVWERKGEEMDTVYRAAAARRTP